MATPTKKYDIEALRKQMKDKMTGRAKDPFEFVPPKAKADEILKYKFFILPDLNKGDKVYGGLASRDMSGMFFLKDGNHWINKKPHACPRVINEEECELCNIGFDLMKEAGDDKKAKQEIAKQWLSQTTYKVNIYFPPSEPNPEAVRGKVFWLNGPKTCFDQWHGAFMRNDGGIPEDPEAYGVFYDPNEAFPYMLVIKQKGEYNDYTGSKFLAGGGKVAIASNQEAIQKILDQRHDLYTKIGTPDPAKIHEIANRMLNGGDTSSDIKATTPADMNGESQAAKAKSQPPQTRKAAPPPPPEVIDEVVGNDEEVQVEEEAPPPPPAAKPKTAPPAAATKPKTAPPAPAAKPKSPPPSDDDDSPEEQANIQALLDKMKGGGVED